MLLLRKHALRLVALAAVAAMPCLAQESSKPAAEGAKKQSASTKKTDSFDKAGKATEKGLTAAGKGTGAAVEHTGRGAVTGAKATAKGASTAATATGRAMKSTAGAVAGVFGKDSFETPDRIRAAQQALQTKGYYGGAIDGIVGPKTRSGMREFQQDEDLKVTGKLNPKTAQRLGVN